MAEWANFGIVAGAAAATLVGLLFVAVTLRVNTVVTTSDLRYRAAQTLALFITVLLISLLLVVPGQPLRLVGVELVIVAVAAGAAMAVFDRLASRATEPSVLARTLGVISLNATAVLLIALSGAIAAAGQRWGIYLLVPGVVAALVCGVVNAWLLLVRLPAIK
ncbi:hypothetical protein [Catellatospora vulcania]|uniref:hypothetical protein n=1 Tax=Catellatospora vulcania TaxID=1460450 RepID=UPI0012D37F74|nr:hypothetical protein [Catellatospora vulcania]